MGTILERCGLAEDMLDSMGQLFGPVRGGLGYSVIIVGFILGAITGTVAGQVIAMAMISLPVMMRWGYNMRYATGALAASGTITQPVPPSLVLIVLADQLGKPVGDMYKGARGPALLQVGLFALYTSAVAIAASTRAGRAQRGSHLPRARWLQWPPIAAGAARHLRRRRLCVVACARRRDEGLARPSDCNAGRRGRHPVVDGRLAVGTGPGVDQPRPQDWAAVTAGRQ